jgi:Putative adhesin
MRVETYPTPGPLRLEVRVPAGLVEVTTADVPETRVEIESLEIDSEGEELALVEFRERPDGGHELTVAIEEERRLLRIFARVPEMAVRISCPYDAELATKTVSADVRGRGRLASAEVKTVSGDLELDRVEGDATAKTVSGDATVQQVGGRAVVQTVSGDVEVGQVVGPVEARTISGDVRVQDAGDSVTAQTVSGDQRFESAGGGAITLNSVSGDLLVGVRKGTTLWIDAKSTSGDTSSDLPMDEAPPDGDGPVVELRATAMSGDIRIVRA